MIEERKSMPCTNELEEPYFSHVFFSYFVDSIYICIIRAHVQVDR